MFNFCDSFDFGSHLMSVFGTLLMTPIVPAFYFIFFLVIF